MLVFIKNNIEKSRNLISLFYGPRYKRKDILNRFHNWRKSKVRSDLEKNAISKLMSKNCDWIIANDISKKNSGFESDYNEVTIHYDNNKKEKLSHKKKSEISEEIVDRIVNQMN